MQTLTVVLAPPHCVEESEEEESWSRGEMSRVDVPRVKLWSCEAFVRALSWEENEEVESHEQVIPEVKEAS